MRRRTNRGRRHRTVILSVFLAMLAASFAVISCGTIPRCSVDIDIRNDSTNYLNWVAVLWDDGKQTVGVMPPGASSINLDAGLPNHRNRTRHSSNLWIETMAGSMERSPTPNVSITGYLSTSRH